MTEQDKTRDETREKERNKNIRHSWVKIKKGGDRHKIKNKTFVSPKVQRQETERESLPLSRSPERVDVDG